MMPTLTAWMIAQETERYARDTMRRSNLVDSLFAQGAKNEAGPSGLGEWVKSLGRLVGHSASPASACCAI